jgi:pimeloyl-ACP methyl ester carboxylesterase
MATDGDDDPASGTGSGDDPSRPRAFYRHRADAAATDAGAGDPVVFAHGTLMDRTMFAPQVEALSGDYRTVAFDFRARTDQYASAYDLWDLADDTAALLDGIGIDSCVLAGMSMGGFAGLRFAERYPARCDGLVLLDSGAGAEDEADRRTYRAMVERAREAGRLVESSIEGSAAVLFGATTRAERPELVARWRDRWRTYPVEAVARELGSWIDREPFVEACRGIDVPALAVHGEEDAAIDPAEAERTVDALGDPDARLVQVPDAGHSANLERPGPVTAAIERFLERVY